VTLPPPPLICAVTAGASSGSALLRHHLDALIAAGVDLIQIREPHLPDAELFELVRAAMTRARGTSTRIVVNDRLDVARAAGADGVHLKASSVPADRVRALAPRPFLIGRSVHDAAEAARAAGEGSVDYLIFGTLFQTTSKPEDHPLTGLSGLRAAAAAASPVPVLGIGGVTLDRIRDVALTGASGIAAIGLFALPSPAIDSSTDLSADMSVDSSIESPAEVAAARLRDIVRHIRAIWTTRTTPATGDR